MKTHKRLLIIVMLLFASGSLLHAQTYQFVWHEEISESDNVVGWCLNHQIVGSWDYHVTFHVNPKTGFVVKQHNNVLHSELTDVVTGEKLVMIDTGNDRLNFWGNWNWWDGVTGAGMPISGWWPDNGGEGSMVAGSFKWISKGGYKVTIHWILQLHINANGEVTADVYKEKIECN